MANYQEIATELNIDTTNLPDATALITTSDFWLHEKLTSKHIVELFNSENQPIKLLKAMLNYLEGKEFLNSLTDIVTPLLLSDLAVIQEKMACFILKDDFCLDIFLKEKQFFPAAFLKIAEKYTYIAYQYIKRARDERLSKLLTLLDEFKDKITGKHFLCQLLSYYDTYYQDPRNPKQGNYYDHYGYYIRENFALIRDLITGNDANDNLLTLSRSDFIAQHLLIYIFANRKEHSNIQQEIELSTIHKVVENQPNLCHLPITYYMYQFAQQKTPEQQQFFLAQISALLPTLLKQAKADHVPSKTVYAEILFTGLLSGENNIEKAVRQLDIETSDEASLTLLFNFAKALHTGVWTFRLDDFRIATRELIKPDIELSVSYLNLLATRNSCPSIVKYAKKYLTDVNFISAYGKHLASIGKYDIAFAIYQRCQLPIPNIDTFKDHDLKLQHYFTYCQNLYNYALIQHEITLTIGNILNKELIHNPNACLNMAEELLLNKKYWQIAAKLLLTLDPTAVEKLNSQQIELYITAATKIIASANESSEFSLANELYKKIGGHKQGKNFLSFGNFNTLDNANNLSSISEIESLQTSLYFYEKAYYKISEISVILKDERYISYKHQSNVNAFVEQLDSILEELVFLIKNTQQHILHLQNPTAFPNKSWQASQILKLDDKLQAEIQSEHILRDHNKPITRSQNEKRLLSIARFGLTANDTNKQPPAARWVQNQEGNWQKQGTDNNSSLSLKPRS